MMCHEKKKIALRAGRALGLCALLLLGCNKGQGTGGVDETEGLEEVVSDREDPGSDWEQAPSSNEDPNGEGNTNVLIYPAQCDGYYYCDDDFTGLYLIEGVCRMSISGFGFTLLPNHTWTLGDIVVGTWSLTKSGFTLCNNDQECSPCEPL